MAAELGLADATRVPIVRFTSPEEQFELVKDCYTEHGFEVEEQGSVFSVDVPPGQRGAMNRVQYECLSRFPIADDYRQEFTGAEYEVIYAHYVETYIPCLEAQGYEVEEPPTRTVYLADPQGYHPMDSVERQVAADIGDGKLPSFGDLEERCPQQPPSEVLYDVDDSDSPDG